MAMARKVEIMRRETIKPSSSTPNHLRIFKISLFDQLTVANYWHVLFFYSTLEGDGNGGNQEAAAKVAERSQLLKKSLSETLTCFYPSAGRIKDDVSIECNDKGVDYLEARVNCHISDVLGQPQLDEMKLFLPTHMESPEPVTGCLLLVQVNFFQCGGIAIGLSISHKIFDATTIVMFLKRWATTTASESDEVVFPVPVFNAASVFPPREDISVIMPPAQESETSKHKCITRRYVFDASKVAALKAQAVSASVPHPTRVEAVSALIWKCAIMVSRSNMGGPRWPSRLGQVVNLRQRLGVSLQENSFGNLAWIFSVTTEERVIDLPGLVNKLRRGIINFLNEESMKKLQENQGYLTICEYFKEIGNMIRSDDSDNYFFSSLIRIPLYEIDFGWGRPTWVSVNLPAKHNTVLFMSTRSGDGIEAFVTLKEEEMVMFECNQELLQYASLNPSVLNMHG